MRKDDIQVELVKQEVKLMKEQNEKDHKFLISGMKDIQCKLDKFIEEIDVRKADRDELNALKTTVYWMGGVFVAFLVWVLQEFLRGLK